jgi:hypothetical protein
VAFRCVLLSLLQKPAIFVRATYKKVRDSQATACYEYSCDVFVSEIFMKKIFLSIAFKD